ncbi:uncharacterized protein LOC119080114 [Bradysia coprophila]|uniref:uncharacterized protein LOC119080114 n=1 Tax=Bradysia coprophila TaxID=38358 RepID=UPI00187DB73E|nr:uncharacterized protein LOC119080114 [Bradysia coprophila]
MKFLIMAILVTVLAMAFVAAVPVDETVVGDLYEPSETYNPQDPNSFFKLKKLKKLLFLG